MYQRVFVAAASSLCVLLSASIANAQIASSCLRPLGIPDKWIENQTPPWDPTDTFDPTGTNPDVYITGFESATDEGAAMQLVLDSTWQTLTAGSALPVQVGEAGGSAFYADIVQCSGYLHAIGESLPLAMGNLTGVFSSAIEALIARDPDAFWDASANGGRGGVVNSAHAQSPRVIALPVFAPNSYVPGTSVSPNIVKIVGFFVSAETTGVMHGYLTGWSQLTTSAITARPGEYAPLSATFVGPGSPVVGMPIEFLVNDTVVATAETDGTGTARPPTMAYNTGSIQPGTYPGAIRVRLAEGAGFFSADAAAADLTILKKLPFVTWPAPADISYGAPLGASQLNATADVPGQFLYSPAAGTVLHAGEYQMISATFVPDDLEQYDEVAATNYVTVVPAPLTVAVTNSSKLYLDPLPTFGLTYTGFVNGDGPAVLVGSPSFQTTATAASNVGTYPVTVSGLAASDYAVTHHPGVLTISPRPTTASLQLSGPNPTTYGQPVSITVIVGSEVGSPIGDVSLFDGGSLVGTASLVDAQATFTIATLNAGSHSLSAQYQSSGGFSASVSSTSSHSVLRASTTTQLTSSVNPSRTGQAVTFTAIVNPVAPGGGVPSGTVEFIRGGSVIATVPLSGGRALFTISSLASGKHSFQARYGGTINHAGSTSALLQQTVKGGK